MASITIQIPDDVKTELEAIAEASDLSVAQIVRFAIRDKIERIQTESPADAPAIVPDFKKAA